MLDFDLISRNIAQAKDASKDKSSTTESQSTSVKVDPVSFSTSNVKPNTGLVQSIASLLNVKLGDDDNSNQKIRRKRRDTGKDDDLSTIENMGDTKGTTNNQSLDKGITSTKAPPFMDIRSKYADKLKKKLDGGSGSLSGVDRMKEERDQALKRGDAAGHLVARSIAASQLVTTTGSKWLANTGTGALLAYLTNRSMKICLIPVPDLKGEKSSIGDDMDSLTRQLPKVRFHSLIKSGYNDASSILKEVMNNLDGLPELGVLVVSDRDDYLGSARQQGMFTCRVRPPNARRGNCTTDYTVETIGEVEQVVNEINGISFNSVLSR